MIPFACDEDPAWVAWFDEHIQKPGMQWLAEHPTGRPKDLWNNERVQERIIDAFRMLCAYTAMHIGANGEIDHFVSLHEDRTKAYEWCNYRYADPRFNKRKSNRKADKLLDPFDVKADWFEILLDADFQLVRTAACPEPFHAKADAMLEMLRLRDDRKLIQIRRHWYEQWASGNLSLEGLEQHAPLVARAVRRKLEEGYASPSPPSSPLRK